MYSVALFRDCLGQFVKIVLDDQSQVFQLLFVFDACGD